MATIKIKRKGHLMNMARNYKIFIDGELVGNVANGATAEFPVTAGKRAITVKIDWCSSPTISVEIGADETKHLTVACFKNSWLFYLGIATICFIPALVGFAYAIILFMIPFLVLIYYTTFGRKKYLTLEETKISV